MEITTSVVLAFILIAISRIITDLNCEPLHRPMWAMRPTFSSAVFAGATWFLRPLLDMYNSTGQIVRSIAFCLLNSFSQIAIVSLAIFFCIKVSTSYFENVFAVIAAVSILMYLIMLLVLPLVSIILIPVWLIVGIPFNIMFPLKNNNRD